MSKTWWDGTAEDVKFLAVLTECMGGNKKKLKIEGDGQLLTTKWCVCVIIQRENDGM